MKSKLYLIFVVSLSLLLSACGKKESKVDNVKHEESTVEERSTNESSIDKSQSDELPINESIVEEKKDPFDFGDINYKIKEPVYDLIESNGYSTYKYSNFIIDDNGRVSEKTVSGDEHGTYSFKYDEFGRIIEKNYTAPSGGYDNYTMTYNENNQIATMAESSSNFRDGNFWEYTYKYDDQGRVIETAETNISSDNYTILYTYVYDDFGLAIQETQTTYKNGLNGSAGHSYEIENTYDIDGNKIKSVSKKVGENKKTITTYIYDCVGFIDYSTETTTELNTTDKWLAFDECNFLPVPDSCVNTISADKTDVNSSANIYSYKLSDDESTANKYYHMYQRILSDICHFTLETDNNGMIFIYQDGNLIAVMMAGNDKKLGYFLQISFSA